MFSLLVGLLFRVIFEPLFCAPQAEDLRAFLVDPDFFELPLKSIPKSSEFRVSPDPIFR